MKRFEVGDLVLVSDNAEFARGAEGTVISVDYVPDDVQLYDAEYMVEFDIPINNPHYDGNEDWEPIQFEEAYFSDNELEPRVRVPKKRTSGFGKFIKALEDRHE